MRASRKSNARQKSVVLSAFHEQMEQVFEKTLSIMQTIANSGDPGRQLVRGGLLRNRPDFSKEDTLEGVQAVLGKESQLLCRIFNNVLGEDEVKQLEEKRKRKKTKLAAAAATEEKAKALTRLQEILMEAKQLAVKLPDNPVAKVILSIDIDAKKEAEPATSEKKRKKKEKDQPASEEKKRKKKEGAEPAPTEEKKKKEKKKEKSSKRKNKETSSASGKKQAKKNSPSKNKESSPISEVSPLSQEDASATAAMLSTANSAKKKKKEPSTDLLTVAEAKERMAKAEREYDRIKQLGQFGLDLQMQGVKAPNLQEVLQNASLSSREQLCQMLAKGNDGTLLQEGKLDLIKWWHLCKEATCMTALFNALRDQAKDGTTQNERYNLIRQQYPTMVSFSQAQKCDRIGRMLLLYPELVYQSEITSVVDWTQKLSNNKALVDSLFDIIPFSSVFLRGSFSLETVGICVFPGLLKEHVKEPLIEATVKACEKNGEVIFNNSNSDRLNDGKRLQVSSTHIEGVVEFQAALSKEMERLFPTLKVKSVVGLMSEPGCKEQLKHSDYTPHALKGLPAEKIPMGVLVASSDGTPFKIWINGDIPTDIFFNKGDAIVFRADFFHAGAAWSKNEQAPNVRFHGYMETEDFVREQYEDGGGEVTHLGK